MKAYIVIKTLNLIAFQQDVNEAMQNGYQPLGGIAIDSRDGYAQAMILEVKRPKAVKKGSKP